MNRPFLFTIDITCNDVWMRGQYKAGITETTRIIFSVI